MKYYLIFSTSIFVVFFIYLFYKVENLDKAVNAITQSDSQENNKYDDNLYRLSKLEQEIKEHGKRISKIEIKEILYDSRFENKNSEKNNETITSENQNKEEFTYENAMNIIKNSLSKGVIEIKELSEYNKIVSNLDKDEQDEIGRDMLNLIREGKIKLEKPDIKFLSEEESSKIKDFDSLPEDAILISLPE
jgi:septal ring factor EnvC (AmiA/AmiB activator)